MEVYLTQESNLEGKKSIMINELSNNLNSFFKNKAYGSRINYLYIGIICVKPEFEIFFKVRNPKYKEVDTIKLFDGSEKKMKNTLSYDIKINFDEFVNASNKDSKKILAIAILNSIDELKLPNKVKDFDKAKFRQDLEDYFIKQKFL